LTTTGPALPLPQHAAKIADEQVGVNGAIAAALTRGVGSMPALYAVLSIVAVWMALATWGLLGDPYPFPFLLFLGNVVQLVLCLVILVGQRVLSIAADRRAVQTYLNAEAIFEQVADLQAHLDRHDRALSRGISLLESSPHPWIERHRVQRPPQARDQAVSVNGRIAAWLTRRLGSMWAVYLAAGTQVVWIGLAVVGLQRVDPYPFAFMTFLSSLAQLTLMLVIMVGQDVLGRAADRRSEQTFLDAEAILHECRRMEARLSAQDRVIDRLTDHTTSQVTEHLARALHATYVRAIRQAQAEAAGDGAEVAAGADSLRPWDELPDELKESNRAQARQVGEKLAAIGCLMVPMFDTVPTVVFEEHELELMARMEHERWVGERMARGYVHGLVREGMSHPDLVPWEDLSRATHAKVIESVRNIPDMLAGAGFQVMRNGSGSRDGAGQDAFTPADWAILQQALMASGVLVALAEGVVDAEEIFALIKKLREASLAHPVRLVRELTGASAFNTGLRPGTRYAEYEGPTVETIRSAMAIVGRVAPDELAAFRAFLVEIAETVGDANEEGGFLGLGARRRVPNEAAAIAVVRRAAGIDA
jgi:uncharacterized membrane protein